MVAMAILSILIVILMGMVDGASKLWRMSENRVDSYREARAGMNLIASDLQSILATTNTNYFSLDRTDNLPSSANKPDSASNIFFVSAQPAESQDITSGSSSKTANTSDLCVVGYFLGYDKISSGSPASSMNLYRYFLSSGEAFDAIRKNEILPETLSTTPSASTPAGAEVLARNVTGFKIRAYTVDYTENPRGAIRPFKQDQETPLPDFLDIELTVLNNDSAKRFNSKRDWQSDTTATYRTNVRKFQTRVYLRADAVSGSTPTPTPTPSPTPD